MRDIVAALVLLFLRNGDKATQRAVLRLVIGLLLWIHNLISPMIDGTVFVSNRNWMANCLISEALGNPNGVFNIVTLADFGGNHCRKCIAGAVNAVRIVIRFAQPKRFAAFQQHKIPNFFLSWIVMGTF